MSVMESCVDDFGHHSIPVKESTYTQLRSAIEKGDHETIKSVTHVLDDLKRYALLTGIKSGLNLLCQARDATTISHLLESLPEHLRLPALLESQDLPEYRNSSIFRNHSLALSLNQGSKLIPLLRSIVASLRQADKYNFLRQQDKGGDSLISLILLQLRRIHLYSEIEKEFFKNVLTDMREIFISLKSCELVGLLESKSNDSSPNPPIFHIFNCAPQITHSVFHVIMESIEPMSGKVAVLSVVDTVWSSVTVFMRLLSRLVHGSCCDGFEENGSDNEYEGYQRNECPSFDTSCVGYVCANITPDDIFKLLKMRKRNGDGALHQVKSITILRIILEKCFNEHDRLALLEMQDHRGSTILHRLCLANVHNTQNAIVDNSCDLEAVLHFMGTKQLQQLLSIRNFQNMTLMDHLLRFPKMSRVLMETLPADKRLETIIRSPSVPQNLEQILHFLEPDERLQLMKRPDSEGNTPMHYLGGWGFEGTRQILRLLPVANRAQLLFITNFTGNSALHCWEHFHNIEELLDECLTTSQATELLMIRNSEGNTILHLMSLHTMIAVIRRFEFEAAAYSFLRLPNEKGHTVFHQVIKVKQYSNPHQMKSVAEMLTCIAPGKRYEVMSLKDEQGNTPLHYAIFGLPDEISTLLACFQEDEKSKLLMMQDLNGDTPIHHIVRLNHHHTLCKVMEEISKGQRLQVISCRNNKGSTVLHIAAKDMPLTVTFIMEQLAVQDIPKLLTLKDQRGYTALDIAVTADNDSAVKSMSSHANHGIILKLLFRDLSEDCLKAAIDGRNIDEAKQVISQLNYYERSILTALHSAGDDQDHLRSVIEDVNQGEIQKLEISITEANHHQLKQDYQRLSALRFDKGSSIIHLLSHRRDSGRLSKLLDAFDPSQRKQILSYRDINGRTPREVACSYEVRQLLEWSSAQEGFYYLPKQPVVLIMYSTTDREGAEEERLELSKVFPQFNVRVREKKDPRKLQMLDEIRMAQMEDEISALIVIIMSHGVQGAVCASDGDVKIQDILRQMCAPFLEGKPKVLMVQACQVPDRTQPSGVQAGADPRPPRSQSIARNHEPQLQPEANTARVERSGYTIESRDVITMMSTVSGSVAYRNLMIPMFAEELRDSTNNGDIYEIFLNTHEKLNNKLKGTTEEDQIPEYRSTLTKKLSLRNIFKQQ